MITVLLATHGRSSLLARTLQSVAACDLPDDYRQLIVVENGKQDGAEQIVKGLPSRLNAHYLFHSRGNKSEALNAAFEIIDDDLVLFLDDDVRLEKNVLCAYSAKAARFTSSVYFGGPVNVDYEVPPKEWVWLPASAKGWQIDVGESSKSTLLFLGCNWAAYARDIVALGRFDPACGPGSPSGTRGQESNMQIRLQEIGIQPTYVSDALVWHFVPADRCSEEWSLQRSYEHAIEYGMRVLDVETDGIATFFGVPRWRLKRLLFSWLGAFAKRMFWSKEHSYKARLQVCREQGVIKGMTLARKPKHPGKKLG